MVKRLKVNNLTSACTLTRLRDIETRYQSVMSVANMAREVLVDLETLISIRDDSDEGSGNRLKAIALRQQIVTSLSHNITQNKPLARVDDRPAIEYNAIATDNE